METIILKIILCSGVLLGLYHLFLAKEKTFIFNRFYLISALIFSFSIPFATIETKKVEKEIPETVFVGEIEQPILQAPIVQQESFDFTEILIIASLIVTIILLLKIVYSVFKIKRLEGRKIIYQNRNVFLLKQNLAPFSFWNTIYLSENYFKDSKIDNAIFLHEEIHVKQKHSADILFVEILKAVFWFNPFMYFYKKAMINNHEFIADESVILEGKNVKNYQELILQEILKQQNLALIHQFNFNNTKKRFIMMTSKNSKFAKAKKMMVIPIFIITGFAFAERVTDKNIANDVINLQSTNYPEFENSNQAITEYLKMASKYDDIIKAMDFDRFNKEVPTFEKKKFLELFNKIDIKDRNKIPFWINYDEIVKQVPTQKQMTQFLDAKYNISINNKTVENNILKNYKNTDFYSTYVLKIQPKHEDYGKYDYGVVLYTNDFARKHNAEKKMIISFTTNRKEFSNLIKNDTITPQKKAEKKITDEKSLNDKSSETVADIFFEDVKNTVDIPAEYPGGANKLRSLVASNFDGSIMKGDEGTLKSVIYFNVDENGKVNNFNATGENDKFNNEAIRVVKLANQDAIWKPAQIDGKAVKYRYQIPLTMNFETSKKTQ